MKRLLLVVIGAAVAALALRYGVHGSRDTTSGIVASLLPQGTIAVALLPDFERTRAQWRQTDIYQLWREPDIQEFLKRPRENVSTARDTAALFEDARRLRIKDAFVALTAWDGATSKVAGGFRFSGSAEDAEKVIKKWRERLRDETADAVSTNDYQGHRIEMAGDRASVYVGNWFFAANDLPTLQMMLDRLDGRAKPGDESLASDATFVAARKPMPPGYALVVYARLDRVIEKMKARFRDDAEADAQALPIRAVCVATAFDGGKIRDTAFVVAANTATSELTRSALAIGSKETFLYAAACLNLGTQPDTSAASANPAALNALPFVSRLATNGGTPEEWSGAFGSEIELVGDWPAESRWPSLLVALPVKDAQKARAIVSKTVTANADNSWSETDKDGAHYFMKESDAELFSLSPTIAVSDQILIAGADAGSVEEALKRSAAAAPGLAALPEFRKAEHTVGAARQSFAYLDSVLLYRRLDSTLRPMLVIGAAFMPRMNDAVDFGKLPAPEVIAKHLSPIVMSQRRVEGGYVSESVGPITAYQALLGLAGMAGFAKAFYQTTLSLGGSPRSISRASPAPRARPTATVSPTPTATPTP